MDRVQLTTTRDNDILSTLIYRRNIHRRRRRRRRHR